MPCRKNYAAGLHRLHRHPEPGCDPAQGYEVFGLSAHSHVEKILQQIEEFHPKYVCMTSEPDRRKADRLRCPAARVRPIAPTGPEGLRSLAAWTARTWC